ncbi:hypothetical protein [Coconut foliar decay alphasatellite 5]|uniref:Uncharacterized protein n=1 Tax=Coconut foliar decay alphasatellite 5 TaxID=2161878 RepID=A0A2R4N9C3_9VIRU|nr:hypothetical protein KM709_gp3 [Coconut foliar decay alphasatellite 5]AVX29434.1 hypothetical protein [Coconut foliar decay alphasatellite 5]
MGSHVQWPTLSIPPHVCERRIFYILQGLQEAGRQGPLQIARAVAVYIQLESRFRARIVPVLSNSNLCSAGRSLEPFQGVPCHFSGQSSRLANSSPHLSGG